MHFVTTPNSEKVQNVVDEWFADEVRKIQNMLKLFLETEEKIIFY